jgi:hypothetical protein
MRKVALLLLASGMLWAATPYFTVEPGEVEVVPQSQAPPLITGSVTLKHAQGGQASGTVVTGGGCLIYLSVPKPEPCEADDKCDRVAGGVRRPGYCAPISDSSASKKVCWYKPEPECCGRRPDPNHPLELNVLLKFGNSTSPYPPGVRRPVRWRVVSCQNLKPGGCKDRSIPNGHLYKYGKTKQFN